MSVSRSASPDFGVGDGDAIDFQGAPDGTLVIGLGFDEIGQGAAVPCPEH